MRIGPQRRRPPSALYPFPTDIQEVIPLRLNQDYGFSLVETLIALTLLSIIAAAFMRLYTGNTLAVFLSGQRTDALYEAQSKVEAQLDKGFVGEPQENLFIKFQDGEAMEVPGAVETFHVEYGKKGREVSITTFIPHRGED